MDPLLPYLKDHDWVVRWCVAEKLGDLGDPKAIKPLLLCLGDKDFHVVKNAYKALLKFSVECIPSAVQLLGHKHVYIRHQAEQLILEMGDISLGVLQKEIDKHNWVVSNRIVHLIWQLGKHNAQNTLIAALGNPNVQKNTIILLGMLKSEAALPHFIQYYSKPSLRRIILQSIKLIGKDTAFPVIVESLSNSALNEQAKMMCLKIGPAILPALVDSLQQGHKNKAVMIELIKKIGPQKVIGQLKDLAKTDKDIMKEFKEDFSAQAQKSHSNDEKKPFLGLFS